MRPEVSPSAQALETVFQDYQQSGQAIDRFLQIIESDQTPFEDVYENLYDLHRGFRQPIGQLFAGKESLGVIQPVTALTEAHLNEPEELSDQRGLFFRGKHSGEYDQGLANSLKPQYVERLKRFMNEARQAIQEAVEFCHAPVKVQSLELIPWTPYSVKFEDEKTGEKIFLSFNNHSISISSERIIDGSPWRTHKTVHKSQCQKDAPVDLIDVSPSKSSFAKERLSQLKPKFIVRNIHDCPWRRDWDDDGYAIHYEKDFTVTCLVLEGELPLMSRRAVQQSGYQNPAFADTTKQ